MKPRFGKVVILGVGLLGASLALALRKKKLAREVWGWGRHMARVSAAKRRGILTHATDKLDEACMGADLIVLCSPFTAFDGLLKACAYFAPANCMITDVGSVKGDWVKRWAAAAAPLRFVGSHPMAGSEKTGFENASQDLFQGAACLVTPLPSTNKQALAKVEGLWRSVGGRVTRINPQRHDQIIGAFSHLTHASAFALAGATQRRVSIKDAGLSGPSFWGATRVAASDPSLWADIFTFNRRELVKQLKDVERELAEIRKLTQTNKVAALTKKLRAIALWRRNIEKSRP